MIKMLTTLAHLAELGLLAFCISLFIWVFQPTAKAESITYPNYAHPVNVRLMILAIAQAENWDGHSVGAAGERGRLQFTASTWYKFTTKPHRWAERRTPEQCTECDRVETAYIIELMQECMKLGRNATPYMIALLHNAGEPVVASGRIPAMKKDFAQRAANLYEEMTK